MSYNSNKSCVTLNELEITSKWTVNSTEPALHFNTIMFPPLLTYTDWHITRSNTSLLYYQFCGPLIVLLRTYAQKINTEIIFRPLGEELAETFFQYIVNFVVDGVVPQMLVFPLVPYTYMDGVFGEDYWITQYIGGLDGDVIVSRTRKLERNAFEYLNCWDRWLYVGILFSLFSISLIPGLRLRSLWEAFESFWDSMSIILSDSISRGHSIRHPLDRLLIVLWLLANTVLISIYSGELYNVLIAGKIIDKIETIEQLYTKKYWKGSKIIMIDLGIIDYAMNGDKEDPIVRDFQSRVEFTFPTQILVDSNLMKGVIKSILTENKVIVANKLSTYYMLRKTENEWPDLKSQYKIGTELHVSEPQRSSMPYFFMYVRAVFDEYHIEIFNQTITYLQESGLIQFEARMSVNPKGFGPDIDSKRETTADPLIDSINIYEIRGVMALLCVGLVFAFVVFIIEIIVAIVCTGSIWILE